MEEQISNKLPRNAPIAFCTQSSLEHESDVFKLFLASHNSFHGFALTPEHAKRLRELLTEHINKYEAIHGQIKSKAPQLAPLDDFVSFIGFKPEGILDVEALTNNQLTTIKSTAKQQKNRPRATLRIKRRK